jgi:hypothetical protein
MNTEKINPLEKHVEKIVLAVAAAGALYLGYLALQPVEVEDAGTTVKADEVEGKLADAVKSVEESEARNRNEHLNVTLPDYVSKYQNLVKNQPLDPKLFAQLPQIGPINAAVVRVDIDPTRSGDLKIVTPTPVDPEFVVAEARQQPVADPGAAPAAAGANAALPTHDQNAVLIQGYIPAAKMQAEMNSVKNQNERLPDNLRQVVIYRIDVQRRERSGNGGWTDWKLVPPTKASPWPRDYDFAQAKDEDQARRMEEVTAEFHQIVLPDFYPDAKGQPIQASILTEKPSKAVTDRTAQLQKELDISNGGTGAAAATPATPVDTPVVDQGGGGGLDARAAAAAAARAAQARGEQAVDQPTAAAPTAAAVDAGAIAALRTQAMIPFAFWDETVEAGHEYQYQVRVRYLNPTFNWTYGLKDEKFKKMATPDSKWVPIPGNVPVSSDVEFFVMNGARNGAEVQGRLFKHTNGKWYRAEISSQPGMEIGGQVSLVDKIVDRRPEQMEVNTGWKIVDAVMPQGGDLHVVLADPTGRMITRDASEDRESNLNKKLLAAAEKPPVTAPPTPPPGRGTPGIRIPQSTGRPGGGTGNGPR